MLQDPLQMAPCPTAVLVKIRDKSKQFSVVIVARYSSFPKLHYRQFEVTLWTVILKWIGLEFDWDRLMERHTPMHFN